MHVEQNSYMAVADGGNFCSWTWDSFQLKTATYAAIRGSGGGWSADVSDKIITV